jgi:hypothetical protein
VRERRYLDVAEVSLTAGRLGIVVKEVPPPLKLHDRVMVRPAQYRFQDPAPVAKGPYGDEPVAYRMKWVSPVE